MISQTSIEQLKFSIDIVDIISNYIPLKKSGANFKGLCPFHGEKTPSFVVSPQKQIFHCFGCGIGGDAIKFVIEYEKLNYPEAIEKVAQLSNFTLTYENSNKPKLNTNIIYQLNDFFKQNLYKKYEAIKYLKDRGVFENIIEKFEIGYSPSSKEIIDFFKKNFLNISDGIKLGLLDNGDNGVYSKFIERIMFPIYNFSNKLVGFGGRTITNHPAKYINSPQSIIFNKSKLLYGLNLAKTHISKIGKMIITEGYLDVIMLHQAGFENVVATLGTALTNEHIPLISKLQASVILAYDGDKAGRVAAFKAAKLLTQHKIETGVVLFEQGLDPADMVKENKIEELTKLINHPIDGIEFIIKEIISSFDIKQPLQKEKALQEVKIFLKTLSEIVANSYIDTISSLLQISPNSIKIYQKTTPQAAINNFKIDIAELSLIKTMLDNSDLKDTIIKYGDLGIFKTHQDIFLIAKNNSDDPRIRDILLNENIKVYNENESNFQIKIMLKNIYEQEIYNIKQNSSLNLVEKSRKIRDLQEKIRNLKTKLV